MIRTSYLLNRDETIQKKHYITCEYLSGTLTLACKCQEQIVQIVILFSTGKHRTRLILSGRTLEL